MFVYISCWGEHEGAPGMGLLRFDEESGEITFLGMQHETLSFGCSVANASTGTLYVTNEVHENPDYPKGGGGLVYAFRVNGTTGGLSLLSRAESACPCPAYLTLDDTGRYLLCANYSGFSAVTRAKRGADGAYHTEVLYDDAFVGVFCLNPDGSIGPLTAIHRHDQYPVSGRGLHAHPHTMVMSPDGSLFACCDKGDAHIYLYRLNRETGALSLAAEPFADAAGSTPRYCAFHPREPYLIVNHEQNMTVDVLRYDKSGNLSRLSTATALPEKLCGQRTAAVRAALRGEKERALLGFAPLEQQGMALDKEGKYLYVALNGPDAIAVLHIDALGGIELIQTLPINGRWVRGASLSPDGRFLLASCLQGGGVYCCPVNADGRLGQPAAHVEIPGASYATFWK